MAAKSVILNMRVSPTVKAALEKLAKKEGKSMASYVSGLILDQLPAKERDKAIREIGEAAK